MFFFLAFVCDLSKFFTRASKLNHIDVRRDH